jgi:thiol-disulfide isomerase/thioredoxin
MLPALLLYASLTGDVRDLIAHHDLAAAERAARSYQARSGATPEFAAALSWIARGEFAARNYDRADALALETRRIADGLLRTRKLDSDPSLATAVGAAIEVHSQTLAARGERGEAVAFLRGQLKEWDATSLVERISKNLNLLNLEGKPAPPLDEARWLGPRPPALSALRGRPVLLFFWAHWCPDCKSMAAMLGRLRESNPDVALLGPTRLYGYVAHGEEAPPSVELDYIGLVRKQSYPSLAGIPVPVSAANFQKYGASTTPTLVLIDRSGIVRWYHPGAVSEPELSSRIQAIAGR